MQAFSRALWDSDLIASRVVLAGAGLLRGLMMLWPREALTSEHLWAMAFVFVAFFQIYILATERFYDPVSRLFAGFSASVWCISTCLMALSGNQSPAETSGNIMLSIAALWIFARPYVIVERMHAHAKRTK